MNCVTWHRQCCQFIQPFLVLDPEIAKFMDSYVTIDKCGPLISSTFLPMGGAGRSRSETQSPRKLVITISRQSGSGAHAVGEKLLKHFENKFHDESLPWLLYDRNLVEEVLNDHNLSPRLARFMLEDRISELTDTLDELFGAHPPSHTLVRQTAETILRLAERGNVILIGRGANIITSKLDYAFHVRLVGSAEKRIERVREAQGVGYKKAAALVRLEDRGRQRYLRKYFGKTPDDCLLYHLVINTDLVSYEQAAAQIARAALETIQVL